MGTLFAHECPDEPDGCPITEVCTSPSCRWDHKNKKHLQCKLGSECKGLSCPYQNHIIISYNNSH